MVAGVKVGVEDSGPPCRPKGSSRLTLQLRRAAPKACASIDELRWERKTVVTGLYYYRFQGARRGSPPGRFAIEKSKPAAETAGSASVKRIMAAGSYVPGAAMNCEEMSGATGSCQELAEIGRRCHDMIGPAGFYS